MPLAAEYRHDSFVSDPEIRIIEGVPGNVEEEVLKHELNHHRNNDEKPMLPAYIMLTGGGLIISHIFGFTPSYIADIGSAVAVLGLLANFYVVFCVEEERANEGVDLHEALDEAGLEFVGRNDWKMKAAILGEISLGVLTTMLGGIEIQLERLAGLARVFSNRSEGGTE